MYFGREVVDVRIDYLEDLWFVMYVVYEDSQELVTTRKIAIGGIVFRGVHKFLYATTT
jgi:hypothetical protein